MEFYYERLNMKEKELYREVCIGLQNMRSQITVRLPIVANVDVQRVMDYVIMDHPEYISARVEGSSCSLMLGQLTLRFNYLLSAAEAKKRLAVMEAKAQEAVRLCKGYSPYLKAIKLHDYLVKNVRYPSVVPTVRCACHGADGALCDGVAVCEGIAEAYQYLCDKAGVPCISVVGDSFAPGKRSERHKWNMIRIGSAWAHVDVTWDITIAQDKPIVCNDYFCLTDERARRDHTYEMSLPPCTAESLYHHRHTHSFVNSEAEFVALVAERLMQGKTPFTVAAGFDITDESVKRMVDQAFHKVTRAMSISYTCNFNQDTVSFTIVS